MFLTVEMEWSGDFLAVVVKSVSLLMVTEVQSGLCKHLSAIASLVHPSSPDPSNSACPLTSD